MREVADRDLARSVSATSLIQRHQWVPRATALGGGPGGRASWWGPGQRPGASRLRAIAVMTEFSRSARETLRLLGGTESASVPPWSVFDADWYRSRYPDSPADALGAIMEWHLTTGQRLGHSPNPYFDEAWQR